MLAIESLIKALCGVVACQYPQVQPLGSSALICPLPDGVEQQLADALAFVIRRNVQVLKQGTPIFIVMSKRARQSHDRVPTCGHPDGLTGRRIGQATGPKGQSVFEDWAIQKDVCQLSAIGLAPTCRVQLSQRECVTWPRQSNECDLRSPHGI